MGKDQDLIEAARSGNLPTVERILNSRTRKSGPLASLRRGPGANVQDASGYTSLHHSALNGHKEIVKLLLTHEASTNVVDHKSSSPLHLAAWTGNTDIVQLLLSHGPSVPNVNLLNHDSETSLHCSAQYGHTEVVSLLLKYKCDPTVRNMKGESALDLAAQYGRLETVQALLKTHPELIHHYIRSHSPLHLASRNGHKLVVQVLLDAGMDVNLQTDNGTALQEASLFGKTEVVKVLLKSGVDVDAVDTRGRTAYNIVNDLNTHVAREISKMIKNHCTLVNTSDSIMDDSKHGSKSQMISNMSPPGDIYENILVPKRVTPVQKRQSYEHDDRHKLPSSTRNESNHRRQSNGSDHFQSPNTHHSSCEDSDVSSRYHTPPPPPIDITDRHSLSSHDGSMHHGSLPPGFDTIDPSSLPPIECTQFSENESAVYPITPAPKEFQSDYKVVMSSSAPSGQGYLQMTPVPPSSKPQLKPPAKPPRRSVNPISPTKLKEISSQGGTIYEYLCLATSGDSKAGGTTTTDRNSGDDYVDMSVKSDQKEDDDGLEDGIYGRIMPRNPPQSNGSAEHNFSALYDDIASGKHTSSTSSFKLCNTSSKSTSALNETKDSEYDDDRPTKPLSLDVRNKRATVNIPLSPTGYDQPPTPDHPPPSPATAIAGIHEKMRPLSRDLTANRLSRDNETLTEDEYFSLEDSLTSRKSAVTQNKCISTENIQRVVEDTPYAGLFRGSSRAYLHMIGDQGDDVKLQVTVREKSSERKSVPVYENVLIEPRQNDQNGQMTNSSSDCKKERNSSVVVMSPFDENAEWAEIADIFASFGSGMARESVFIRDMEEKFASTLSLGARKSDSSDNNEDLTFDNIAEWLKHLDLLEYQSLLINNGLDDIKFMGGSLIEDQDLVDIGISQDDHRKKILKSCRHLPQIQPVCKETDSKGVLKIKPESVDEWLKSLQLQQYCDAFHKNDYHDMYRVMKVWEVELNTVLEIRKIGHRKRILTSLGERIANQYTNLPDVDWKDLDIDLSKLELDNPPLPSSTKEPSLFRDYTNLKAVPPPQVPAGWKSSKEAAQEQKLNLTIRPPQDLLSAEEITDHPNLGIRSPAELFSGIPISLTTQWRHDPKTLINGCCNYTAQYLGSTLVKELKGMESTRKSIQKLKNSTREIGKIPNVVLSMSHKGVKFIDAQSKQMVCAHEIQNIHCACQDADDLNHFAYITKDHSTNHHYCHVFSVSSMDLATEIILTLGEAFEVAYQMALQEKSSSSKANGGGSSSTKPSSKQPAKVGANLKGQS